MEDPLKELYMEVSYRPGKETMADEFTRLGEDQGDGRYRGILLGQDKFSQEAWQDIQRWKEERGKRSGINTGPNLWDADRVQEKERQ
jgi:hypothetical protein